MSSNKSDSNSEIRNPKSADDVASHVTRHASPIIGITVDARPDPSDARTQGKLQLNWNYAQAVADAGGVPLLIPPMADMEVVASLIDGWLIPGGLDIDAAYWGEENHPTVKLMAAERHEADRRLYGLIDPEMPVFGICYGCQFLNVVRGGSLIQHLPDVVGHESHTDGGEEQICIEADSKLGSLVGPSSRALSFHHQAVDRLGEGLRQNASHTDGTVEGIEATDRPWVVGVQWHPERSTEDEESRRLFAALVEQARAFKAKKAAR